MHSRKSKVNVRPPRYKNWSQGISGIFPLATLKAVMNPTEPWWAALMRVIKLDLIRMSLLGHGC